MEGIQLLRRAAKGHGAGEEREKRYPKEERKRAHHRIPSPLAVGKTVKPLVKLLFFSFSILVILQYTLHRAATRPTPRTRALESPIFCYA